MIIQSPGYPSFICKITWKVFYIVPIYGMSESPCTVIRKNVTDLIVNRRVVISGKVINQDCPTIGQRVWNILSYNCADYTSWYPELY